MNTHRAVVCVNIGSAAISTVIFTIFSIQYTIIAIIISMPARWCAFQTITILIVHTSIELGYENDKLRFNNTLQ